MILNSFQMFLSYPNLLLNLLTYFLEHYKNTEIYTIYKNHLDIFIHEFT